MEPGDEFSELLDRVRRGDAEAARHLVGRYESAIRVAVRTRLSDPRLRRQFDSMDVCQSVLASFFVNVAAGAYDLSDPGQLLALLTKMAQNKLGMRVRSGFRRRRDVRRTTALDSELTLAQSRTPDPLDQASVKDLLERALAMMSPEVRQIADFRMRGERWSDVAAALGGTPEARRKQFQRAVEQIADALDSHVVGG